MKFTNNQIRAIYILYGYGFNENEILSMLKGKNIYETIETKVNKTLGKITEYLGEAYINHISYNVSIEEVVREQSQRKQIIDSLIKLKEDVEENSDTDFLIHDIEEIVNILNNIDNVQEAYNLLVVDIFQESKNKKRLDHLTTYIGKSKENKLKLMVSKEIITKEQWRRVQEVVQSKK